VAGEVRQMKRYSTIFWVLHGCLCQWVQALKGTNYLEVSPPWPKLQCDCPHSIPPNHSTTNEHHIAALENKPTNEEGDFKGEDKELVEIPEKETAGLMSTPKDGTINADK